MLGLCSVAGVAPASAARQQQAPAAEPSPASGLEPLFVGQWTGVLEYRDFQSDGRVQLPTWLAVKLSADLRHLEFTYTYDDGPNKTVVEISTVTIDAAASQYTITSDRDHSSETYQIAGLQDLAIKRRGVLTLTGTGTENEKKVDVRITITIGRNIYKFTKETRLPGQDFLFRDGYVMTRREPPQVPAVTPSH